MATNRRGAQGKPKGSASRRALPPRDETVVSEGKSYRRFNVGDRLDSRNARNPRSSTVTAADYADYLNNFGGSRPISTGKPGGRAHHAEDQKDSGQDTVAADAGTTALMRMFRAARSRMS